MRWTSECWPAYRHADTAGHCSAVYRSFCQPFPTNAFHRLLLRHVEEDPTRHLVPPARTVFALTLKRWTRTIGPLADSSNITTMQRLMLKGPTSTDKVVCMQPIRNISSETAALARGPRQYRLHDEQSTGQRAGRELMSQTMLTVASIGIMLSSGACRDSYAAGSSWSRLRGDMSSESVRRACRA